MYDVIDRLCKSGASGRLCALRSKSASHRCHGRQVPRRPQSSRRLCRKMSSGSQRPFLLRGQMSRRTRTTLDLGEPTAILVQECASSAPAACSRHLTSGPRDIFNPSSRREQLGISLASPILCCHGAQEPQSAGLGHESHCANSQCGERTSLVRGHEMGSGSRW